MDKPGSFIGLLGLTSFFFLIFVPLNNIYYEKTLAI